MFVKVPHESNPIFMEWAWQKWRQETEQWCPNRQDAINGMERIIESQYNYRAIIGHMICMWDTMVHGIDENDQPTAGGDDTHE